MLKSLRLTNVGPAKLEGPIEFGARLNLVTGDNGLGKSFLLDIAWWALTRKWPMEVNPKLSSGAIARPVAKGSRAEIGFTLSSETRAELAYTGRYDREEAAWTGKAGRPPNPGLVLYAQADGSFAVWDPARNYWKKKGSVDIQERQPAYVFSAAEVWDGLPGDAGRPPQCNGLISDWAGWQKENGEAFATLCRVLQVLSPSEAEVLQPGGLTRITIDDSRDMPTITMPYGQDVPIVHASAGIRRIVALAYLLVWSWQEHKLASELLGKPTTHQAVFLVDEIEAHLHPRWQRRIISALLEVADSLTDRAEVQLITATHSPLVMASVEPHFQDDLDCWFDMDLNFVDGLPEVLLQKRPFLRCGDASHWLTSDAFDLPSARSLEAEEVLEQATQALSSSNFSEHNARQLNQQLKGVLGDTDPFWLRWRFFVEKQGWQL